MVVSQKETRKVGGRFDVVFTLAALSPGRHDSSGAGLAGALQRPAHPGGSVCA